MKNMVRLLAAGLMVYSSWTDVFAQEKPRIEVMSSWTSGGEAAALNVIRTEFQKRGGTGPTPR